MVNLEKHEIVFCISYCGEYAEKYNCLCFCRSGRCKLTDEKPLLVPLFRGLRMGVDDKDAEGLGSLLHILLSLIPPLSTKENPPAR